MELLSFEKMEYDRERNLARNWERITLGEEECGPYIAPLKICMLRILYTSRNVIMEPLERPSRTSWFPGPIPGH